MLQKNCRKKFTNPPKKRPGRKPAVDHNDIVKVIKSLNIFDEKGNLRPKRNDVWGVAVHRLKFKIKRHNLYCYVQQWKLVKKKF